MIRETTNYVLASFMCPSDIPSQVDNWIGNILHDFNHKPTLDEIKETIIKDGNRQVQCEAFSYCIINNLQFLSRQAYLDLGGK